MLFMSLFDYAVMTPSSFRFKKVSDSDSNDHRLRLFCVPNPHH